MNSLDTLLEAALEPVVDARHRHERAPRVRFEIDVEAGTTTIAVVVDSEIVAAGSAACLEVAARRAYQAYVHWSDDSPAGIAHALKVSIEMAKAERAGA